MSDKWLICEGDAADDVCNAMATVAGFIRASDEAVAKQLGVDVATVAKARAGEVEAAKLEISNGVARICVRGPLFEGPDAWLDMWGYEYSDYQTIRDQVAQANGDEHVDSIVLDVDSPGGTVKGAFEAADAIRDSGKPVEARVDGMAASAGYLLACQATTITVGSRVDQVGSIGTAISMWMWAEVVHIASTKAPKKRPDVSTDAGKAIVREELDQWHELFVEAIVAGRGVTADKVDTDFGQGGMLLARKALAVGMVDSMREPDAVAPAASGGHSASPSASIPAMNIETLKREHPELYAEAVALGVAQEMSRVQGHLKCGLKVNRVAVAIKAIQAGDEVDVLDYVTAALDTKVIEARDEAAVETRGADSPDAKDPVGDLWAEAALELGVDINDLNRENEGK